MNSIGVYIHIPYCIQRCRYCDFTTFEQDKILPPSEYVEHLKQEIRQRFRWAPSSKVHSIYFGGGTPSLIDSSLIVSIVEELANEGMVLMPQAEVTIEINPATLDPKKIEDYLKVGVNRFSVGAQSFDDDLLKLCGRRHNAQDTRDTLALLNKSKLNYSFDLLFGLPHQTQEQLLRDLEEVQSWSPNHLSAYCLTVPQGHPMSYHRPSEDKQIEMFQVIEQQLLAVNLHRYEISNFSRPGFESQHNYTYWNDRPYMGFGLSAHSYFPKMPEAPFGVRFWNPTVFDAYFDKVSSAIDGPLDLPQPQREVLKEHEALTDFFHMHLRTEAGLPADALRLKFPRSWECAINPLEKLENQNLIQSDGTRTSLTSKGRLMSNQVFAQLTFTAEDLTS
ncbi:MAG: coproporphyrinogen III oxidase [Bdellovibrionaceae bacterium]|nr:coproporphyrinogen III oxidase [Pseudobdellovibrionaceae bacterium]